MSEQKKWAEKLSAQCSLSPAFLESAMEELSESCYGDSKTAQEIIKDLTLSCQMNEGEVNRFIKEVSKNCPIDAKKLREEVAKAKGEKEVAFEAIDKAGTKGSFARGGVQ